MNDDIISSLDKLRQIAGMMGELYKEKAYNRAISIINQLNPVITINNLTNLAAAGVGEAIITKIHEKLSTGHIRELDKLLASRKVKTYIEFSKILGVGPNTIEKWLNLQINTLPKLRRAVAAGKIKLTNMQKYGLLYYNDLNMRIPRDEITKLGQHIKQILINYDPNIIFEIAGSYRRGAESSGDIDILITNKHHFDDNLLYNIVSQLQHDTNFIGLIVSGKERMTFLYLSQISGYVRQIDILNIRYSSFYAALLYFTGSGSFNESMRGYAKSKGFKLNQIGLYKMEKNNLRLIPSASEHDIFKMLDIEYIPPHNRTIFKVPTSKT